MVRHYAFGYGFDTFPNLFVYKTKPRASLREVLQQIRERMEAIAKGIVSDHWSTVI